MNWPWDGEYDDAMEMQPNTVPVSSIAMADYLIDRGLMDRSNCVFLMSPAIHEHVKERLRLREQLVRGINHQA